MKYAKLIDGALQYAPKRLTINGRVHYHPSVELYESLGYLEVVETPYPEISEGEEAKYYESYWEEQNGQIVKVWTETEPSEPTISGPTIEDRMIAVESECAENREALEMILSGVTE